ncbi:MAG: endonuclease, partial [Desulfobacterales bacterium]|nr:endonuclease [Desulfobacterales bacterium]
MSVKLRIATFNLENLDDKPGKRPTLDDRIAVMRPQLMRLNADIVCLQEVNGQEEPGEPRRVLALERLLGGTPYAEYHTVSTMTADGIQVYDERNLVILSRYEVADHHQYKNDYAPAPRYQKVTAEPQEDEANDVTWERPILHAKIKLRK